MNNFRRNPNNNIGPNTRGWGNRYPPARNINIWQNRYTHARNINIWQNRYTPARIASNPVKQNPVKESNCQTISILDNPNKFNIYNYIPRYFTLNTNNSSGKFNQYLLINCSSIISQSYTSNPNNLKYTLDIDDDQNVIGKLEKLFQGESVKFYEDDICIFKKIKTDLNLINLPDIDEASFKKKFVTINLYKTFEIYSKQEYLQSFIIQTKKAEYKVNFFGIHSSSVIRDFLSKTSDSDRYIYDYEDEGGEFQYICDFFNFKKVEINNNNCQILKEICEDLKIDFIFNEIDNFVEKIEKVSQTIDDQQEVIDKIDDLFGLLYHIKEKSANDVSSLIEESVWCKTENNVIELAAFIFQVLQTKIELHPYLIDLLIKLNESENVNLKTLLPFFTNFMIKITFDCAARNFNFNFIYPFVYLMYKREIIPRDVIISKIKKYFFRNNYFNSWFFPEVTTNNPRMSKVLYDKSLNEYYISRKIENKKDNNNNWKYSWGNINNNNNQEKLFLLHPVDPKNIEEFKQMRDKGEYDNEIATSIRNDDVDTFQAIITKIENKSFIKIVQKNMFEPQMQTDLSFLNYAALHGSIKCFKYLLLNDEQIDDFTFQFAVIGGNTELIRIVYNDKSISKLKEPIYYNALKETIKLHRNDIFDWILEQKLSEINQKDNFINLMILSIENCNVHSIVQLIDNGFNILDYESKYS